MGMGVGGMGVTAWGVWGNRLGVYGGRWGDGDGSWGYILLVSSNWVLHLFGNRTVDIIGMAHYITIHNIA